MDENPPWTESVRHLGIQAALEAYDDAGLQGLRTDGRWELAVDSLRHLDPSEASPSRR